MNWSGNGTESALIWVAGTVHGPVVVAFRCSYQGAMACSSNNISFRIDRAAGCGVGVEVREDETDWRVMGDEVKVSTAFKMFGSGSMISHHWKNISLLLVRGAE